MPISDDHWLILKDLWADYQRSCDERDWNSIDQQARTLAEWIPDLIKEIEELRATKT